MRRLILLRHAKTERDSPTGQDKDRRLDERGRHDGADIGKWLAAQGFNPDVALVSTAVRARETWDLISPFLPSTKVKHLPELYAADVTDLLTIIHGAMEDDPKSLLVVAHNPGLHELALALIGSGDESGQHELALNLPTSGVAVIDFRVNDWGDVHFRGGRLECFASPRLLREQFRDI